MIVRHPKQLDLPEDVSLGEYILNAFKKVDKNKTALIEAETGRRVTYGEAHKNILAIGSALWRHGVRKGDVFLMLAPNSVEYPCVQHAASCIGATVAFYNALSTKGEVKDFMELSKAAYVMCGEANLQVVEEAITEYKGIKKVFVHGQTEKHVTVSSLLSDDGSLFELAKVNHKEDVAMILCSSGTTGRPKAVMHTHYSIVACASILGSDEVNVCKDSDMLLCFVPMFHLYGAIVFNVVCIALSATYVTMTRFDLKLFLDCIQNYKVSLLHIVPPIAVALTKHPMVDKYDLSSVKMVICGAAPMAKATTEALTKRLNVPFVRQGYGMTEVGVSHLSPTEGGPFGSCGKVLPGYDVKVVDVQTGETAGENETGEICFYTPCRMKGYKGNAGETAAMIDKDGWVHSGDIGHFDENRHFFVTDRLKELIKYKAYQVAPAELEDLLLTHPAIADAAVIGVPDEEAGELPKAFVVKVGSSEVTDTDIVNYVNERVAPQKKIRAGVEFIDAIPKSASGKIMRRILRDKVKEA